MFLKAPKALEDNLKRYFPDISLSLRYTKDIDDIGDEKSHEKMCEVLYRLALHGEKWKN